MAKKAKMKSFCNELNLLQRCFAEIGIKENMNGVRATRVSRRIHAPMSWSCTQGSKRLLFQEIKTQNHHLLNSAGREKESFNENISKGRKGVLFEESMA